MGSGSAFRAWTTSRSCRDFGEPAGLIPLAEMERDYLEKVLNATHWKVSGRNGAAAILGLKPTTLFFRMKKLGLRK